MTSIPRRRGRTVVVGRTIVFVDSHSNPYEFRRDGVEVECVCDPGHLVCLYHLRAGKAARQAEAR
jgi:hypothetical protein